MTRGVDVVDVQLDGGFPVAARGEAQQQPEGVAVGGDRVRAGLALGQQPLGEERLQGGSERAHGRSPRVAPGAPRPVAMSSGAAERYQYVEDGSTWPR